MKLYKITIVLLLLFIQLLFATIALSKDVEVVFVDIEGQSLKDAEEIQLACDLLGVRFKTQYIRTKNDTEILKSITAIHEKEVLILTERVLKYFNKNSASMFGQSDRKTKILILGIKSDTDIADLKIWSENRIQNLKQFALPRLATLIRVVKNDQISKELGGLEYPLIGSGSGMINGFELVDSIEAASLIEVIEESGKPLYPIFLKTDSAKKNVFFLTSWEKVMSAETNSLLKIMPILMFLKYSFGDRCWHGMNDYANFTIDDPWLREPYGYISFKALCRDAKKAPFHVTISFIPYNYQKSHDGVVEIFRQCQANLSIAIHGNNHDFSEFRSRGNTQLSDKKLSIIPTDEKNILQALYRMDSFSRNTGIPFDRVMIFPRAIFDEESLGLLKKHNFLMTVNWGVPLDAGIHNNQVDRMREISLEFENFPMLRRFQIPDWKNDKRAVAVAKRWIQMRLFLDLPVLLYTHHEFFKDGVDGFNAIANTINKAQPDVVWASLGNIAKKLYLEKRIDDSEIEIMAFSSDLVIKNNHNIPMKYTVRKQEDFLTPIESVKVDGIKHEYHQDGKNIRVEVMIEPGGEKNIQILYHSDFQVGSFTYSDNGLQTILVRSISDFRDLYLSKIPFGDKMVMIFYLLGGVKYIAIYISGLIGIILILLILYIKSRKTRKGKAVAF